METYYNITKMENIKIIALSPDAFMGYILP